MCKAACIRVRLASYARSAREQASASSGRTPLAALPGAPRGWRVWCQSFERSRIVPEFLSSPEGSKPLDQDVPMSGGNAERASDSAYLDVVAAGSAPNPNAEQGFSFFAGSR
jgi:hypothetical protein